MNKQEKMWKGVREILEHDTIYKDDDGLTYAILNYLHSQGVVIKVDKELPDIRFHPSASRVYDRYNKPISHTDAASYTQQDMLEAGYVATEPLIKEAT